MQILALDCGTQEKEILESSSSENIKDSESESDEEIEVKIVPRVPVRAENMKKFV